MVENSTSPFQTDFGPVFGDEAVQRDLLFPEPGSIRVFLRALSPISPRYVTAPTSDFLTSQEETGGKGHGSTSRAVQTHERHAQCLVRPHQVVISSPPFQ